MIDPNWEDTPYFSEALIKSKAKYEACKAVSIINITAAKAEYVALLTARAEYVAAQGINDHE